MKKKVLSLALALALCLGLTVHASAAETLKTVDFSPAKVTNVLYYGNYLDAIALNTPGLPIVCRGSTEISLLEPAEQFSGQTRQSYYEDERDYLQVQSINGTPLNEEAIYGVGSKIVLEERGVYVIDILLPEAEEIDPDPGVDAHGSFPSSYCIQILGPQDEAPSKDPFNPFFDVPATSPYSDGVKWATKTKVTTGKTVDNFGPNDICTVSHILTFLYRAYTMYDKTEVTVSEREAVLAWAKENGLIKDGQGLDSPCTRAMAVTFMWKAAGCPETHGNSTFVDVPAGAEYKQAVDWAVEREITSGTGDGTTFSPNNTCTRGQIVTFLFRDFFDGGF
ncbi:MAG: S-layer homology domain-containing protein [Oscillibacter sp.]|nr:S-layer homology domain-containing protein [Oscillibacter sp.]